jgi:hypothetical protein
MAGAAPGAGGAVSVTDRRAVPPGSGAAGCVCFSWQRIVEILGPEIKSAAPEIRRHDIWLVRARPNGIRIELFADDAAFRRRLADPAAGLADGPQVHAGRLR